MNVQESEESEFNFLDQFKSIGNQIINLFKKHEPEKKEAAAATGSDEELDDDDDGTIQIYEPGKDTMDKVGSMRLDKPANEKKVMTPFEFLKSLFQKK